MSPQNGSWARFIKDKEKEMYRDFWCYSFNTYYCLQNTSSWCDLIQMLAAKLNDDPRNFVENKIKELLVHKRLILSNKFFPCNFSSLGCIGFRTEVFEMRL